MLIRLGSSWFRKIAVKVTHSACVDSSVHTHLFSINHVLVTVPLFTSAPSGVPLALSSHLHLRYLWRELTVRKKTDSVAHTRDERPAVSIAGLISSPEKVQGIGGAS